MMNHPEGLTLSEVLAQRKERGQSLVEEQSLLSTLKKKPAVERASITLRHVMPYYP